jgi:hypothetical protein
MPNKFQYYTKSADGKMTGVVSSAYIRDILMNRTITSVATMNDDSGIDLNLSDGAFVSIRLMPDHAEIQYYRP